MHPCLKLSRPLSLSLTSTIPTRRPSRIGHCVAPEPSCTSSRGTPPPITRRRGGRGRASPPLARPRQRRPRGRAPRRAARSPHRSWRGTSTSSRSFAKRTSCQFRGRRLRRRWQHDAAARLGAGRPDDGAAAHQVCWRAPTVRFGSTETCLQVLGTPLGRSEDATPPASARAGRTNGRARNAKDTT